MKEIDDDGKKEIFSIASNIFSIKMKKNENKMRNGFFLKKIMRVRKNVNSYETRFENQSSVNYKSLVGSTEFIINNGGNDWLEDIQFELQTSNWDDEKKFKIIVNGKTIVEKVCLTFFQGFLSLLSLVCTKRSSNI